MIAASNAHAVRTAAAHGRPSAWALAPWTDVRGRLSWLKAAVLALLLTPGGLLLADALAGDLGARPWDAAIHRSGWWAVTFVLISLAVTPASRVFRWGGLTAVRRMIGVTAFLATAAHLILFLGDKSWSIGFVAREIVLRWYLAVGFVAFVGLLALAATSTDGMVRRLGGRRWRRLHACAYGIAALAILHFYMQTKLAATEPVFYAGLFLWLMGWRAARRLGGAEPGLVAMLLLAAGTALSEALIEAAILASSAPVPLWRVLAANVDPDLAAGRPAWWLFGAGLAVAATAWVRARRDRAAPRTVA